MTDIFESYSSVVRRNVPLAMHAWLQLGGPVDYFAEPQTQDELVGILQICREHKIPVRVLGFGSNILVSDAGVSGMVIRLTSAPFGTIHHDENIVTAGSGAKLGRVITYSVYCGLAGLEGLIGIPGTVGGVLRGNAGTNSTSVGQWIDSVTVLNPQGELVTLKKNDITFSYRNSTLDEGIILRATFRLEPEEPAELAKRLQQLWIVRKNQQPMGHQCGGRLFRNPVGWTAGELIDKVGMKGTRVGGAVIADRDGNFVIVEPECTTGDVLRLIELVREKVAERFQQELELDLEIW